jgi:hypothetical protein
MSSSFRQKYALAGLIVLLPTGWALAQAGSTQQTISANDLVRAVVANELKAHEGNRGRWMFRADSEEQGSTQAKEVIQSEQGSLDRIIAIDGQPLNSKQERDERQRIENFVKNPPEQQRLEQTKKKDAEQSKALFKMLPDALTFSYAGRQGDVIKLNYRPNPDFQPPLREARVFHQMEGEMWVHEAQRRLVHIQGQLTGDVKFAGGWLGHLEKGGHFNVEQRELSPGQWDLVSMEVSMKGKVLLFKPIAVQEKEYRSDFRAIPCSLTLAEAAAMLMRQPVIMAANR